MLLSHVHLLLSLNLRVHWRLGSYFIEINLYANVLSCFSCVWVFFTLWTIAPETPLSMGFSRQECWSGLPCPPPGDLPDPGNEPVSLRSPALAGGFFTTSVGTKYFWIDKLWNYSLNTIFVAKSSVTWIRTLSGFTV